MRVWLNPIHSAMGFNLLMNELQRQAYLSALGIENYAPRWLLPAAPVSAPCVMPVMPVLPDVAPLAVSAAHVASVQAVDYRKADSASPAELLNTIGEFKEEPKKAPLALNASVIVQQLEEKKAAIVKAAENHRPVGLIRPRNCSASNKLLKPPIPPQKLCKVTTHQSSPGRPKPVLSRP